MKGLNSATSKINYLGSEGVCLSLENAEPNATLLPELTGTRFHQRHKNGDSKARKCKSGSHRYPASIKRCGSSAFLKANLE